MQTHLLIINIVTILWSSTSVADIGCHLPGYTHHGTSCFKLYSIKKYWVDAEASCVADGGHLASIHSSDEQAFIANLAAGAGPWIGLTGTPPDMTWSDGTDVDYDNWEDGAPSRIDVSCVRIMRRRAFAWKDVDCPYDARYICRIEPEAYFMKVADGMDANPNVSPSFTHTVRSRVECAWRCQQDSGCKHFTMTEDEGKYVCETYTTLYEPSTPASPPTYNYRKIYPWKK